MWKIFLSFSLIAAAWSWNLPVAAQQNRELTVENSPPQKRTALVIGNGDYAVARKLSNPVNDADDMAKTLSQLGFEVISGTNLSLRQMNDKVREFGDKLKKNGGVGLFYYAGHGIQVGGKNFLIPVEAEIPREDEVDFNALNLDQILRKMATANNGLNIVILDACRNNPFARSWSRDIGSDGLAQVSAPTGTFIAYATSPDHAASDGTGRNGLYTTELLKYIRQPNLKIEEAFKEVRKAVDRVSGGKQIPWDSSSLRGEFYFNPGAKTNSQSTSTAGNDSIKREQDAWDLIENSTDPQDFRIFLEEFPGGENSALARIKLKRLEARQKASNGASNPLSENSGSVSVKTSKDLVKAGTIRKNSIGMELVYIPSGEFLMGSTEADISEVVNDTKRYNKGVKPAWFANETPPRRVAIKEGFWIGKYEITQGQWKAVMGKNLSSFDDCGDNCPVEQVSWIHAKEFIARLNAKNDGFEYRLPSEAEWEYAARAGTTTAFAFGDGLSSEQANFNGSQPFGNGGAGVFLKRPAPVGSYQPNAWGLHDMYGNVAEWCEDIYSSSYNNLPTDGSANVNLGSPSYRVLRGGSWGSFAFACRSAARLSRAPTTRDDGFGFRIAARLKQ